VKNENEMQTYIFCNKKTFKVTAECTESSRDKCYTAQWLI